MVAVLVRLLHLLHLLLRDTTEITDRRLYKARAAGLPNLSLITLPQVLPPPLDTRPQMEMGCNPQLPTLRSHHMHFPTHHPSLHTRLSSFHAKTAEKQSTTTKCKTPRHAQIHLKAKKEKKNPRHSLASQLLTSSSPTVPMDLHSLSLHSAAVDSETASDHAHSRQDQQDTVSLA